MAKEKYGSNRKYSGSQLAKISELRKKLDMGDASQEEVAKEAKRLGVKGFKDGGEAVPAKFKGFSKLPEKVQQKMDPDLAQKYEKGGAVGNCRGMGAALRGGKFSGVK